MLELITSLYRGGANLQWLVCGNFNESVNPKEKCGCKKRVDSYMDCFKNTINGYEFMDLGFKRP